MIMLTWEITQIYHRYLKGRLIKLVKSLVVTLGVVGSSPANTFKKTASCNYYLILTSFFVMIIEF